MSRHAAVVTVSDRATSGEYEDRTGPAVVARLAALGFEIVSTTIVPDEYASLTEALQSLISDGVPLIVTNGGTGLGPRDITPDVTRSLLDVEAPGMGELMRLRSFEVTPLAALSRATAGRARSSLIVNVPGATKGAVECLDALAPVLQHAIDQISGGTH